MTVYNPEQHVGLDFILTLIQTSQIVTEVLAKENEAEVEHLMYPAFETYLV